jgi:hypothetical protein
VAVDSYRCRSYHSEASQLKGWISLYDVIRRKGTYFLNVYRLLVAFEQLVAMPQPRLRIQQTSGPPIESNPLNPPTLFSDLLNANFILNQPAITLEQINTQLTLVEEDANELGLEGTADRIRATREYVAQQTTLDFQGDEHLRHDVRVLRETLTRELEKRWVFIPDLEIYRKYFDKSFGDEVDDAFPDARRDTTSAANSYIYDEPEACIFHCMRTAEYGLRGLAKKIMPKLRAERLEWGSIIRELRRRIEEQHQSGKKKLTPQRKQRLDFYSGALDQCVYFKGIRDDNAHPRATRYEAADALKALTHVEEFMKLLAKNGIKLVPKIAG